MKAENEVRTAAGFYLLILGAALLSAVLGAGFGARVAATSPELVADLFGSAAEQGVYRYALAVGMITGLLLGAAVAGFACLLGAFIKILRIRLEVRSRQQDPGISRLDPSS